MAEFRSSKKVSAEAGHRSPTRSSSQKDDTSYISLSKDYFIAFEMPSTSLLSLGSKVPWPNSAEGYEVKEVLGVDSITVTHAAYCKPRDEECHNKNKIRRKEHKHRKRLKGNSSYEFM